MLLLYSVGLTSQGNVPSTRDLRAEGRGHECDGKAEEEEIVSDPLLWMMISAAMLTMWIGLSTLTMGKGPLKHYADNRNFKSIN